MQSCGDAHKLFDKMRDSNSPYLKALLGNAFDNTGIFETLHQHGYENKGKRPTTVSRSQRQGQKKQLQPATEPGATSVLGLHSVAQKLILFNDFNQIRSYNSFL
ncbi:Uncharacterized protein Fot_30563 [Forsythia ovata]|uniref:Pentatricopeptide repeat-containing protein n=1 Tax=Forsythia ovata TaxID=205694 RepID=A0ABD1P4H4_9LAMI